MKIIKRLVRGDRSSSFGVNLIVTKDCAFFCPGMVRCIYQMFLKSSVPLRVIKLKADDTGIREATVRLRYNINVFLCSPEEISSLDPKEFDKTGEHHSILYYLWELSKPSQLTLTSFRRFEEIWFPCEDQRDEISSQTDVRTRFVPIVLTDVQRKQRTRRFFSLPELSFIAYCEISSDYPFVHNLEGVLTAFRKAFLPHDITAHLVIKINGNINDSMELIQKVLKGYHNYTVFGNELSCTDTDMLLRVCDVVISLRRSTAFDISVHKAMQSAVAVIAPSFFSNTELISQSTACKVDFNESLCRINYHDDNINAIIAEPDVVQSAVYMKILHCDMHYRRQMSDGAKRFYTKYRENIRRTFDLDKILYNFYC